MGEWRGPPRRIALSRNLGEFHPTHFHVKSLKPMNDLILHSFRRCPFAIRVRMTLEEKSLVYSVIEENLSAPSEQLLRLHPEGKVPLLLHQGQAIHESAIITEYLEDRFPTPSLRLGSPLERARLRLWTYWCDVILKPDLDAYKYDWADLSDVEKESLLGRLRGHLEKLDHALVDRPSLMGAQLTLADIHVFPFYRQLSKARPDFAQHFAQGARDLWLERIIQRPSFERVMSKKLD